MNTPLFARAALVIMLAILALGQYSTNHTLREYHTDAVKSRAVQRQISLSNAHVLQSLEQQLHEINRELNSQGAP